jgi:hypothetical protein
MHINVEKWRQKQSFWQPCGNLNSALEKTWWVMVFSACRGPAAIAVMALTEPDRSRFLPVRCECRPLNADGASRVAE